jgi:hypothetical protein
MPYTADASRENMNDKTVTTIRLNSSSLRHKFGFDDGDLELGRYDDLQKSIVPADRHLPFHHELLARTVEEYLLPKLPEGVKTFRIGTCHNPCAGGWYRKKDVFDATIARLQAAREMAKAYEAVGTTIQNLGSSHGFLLAANEIDKALEVWQKVGGQI